MSVIPSLNIFRLKELACVRRSRAERQSKGETEDNNQCSLSNLSYDVLIPIFDLIRDTSPRSLHALALVSRSFYRLADYCRHKRLVLTLDPSNLEASQRRLQYIHERDLLPAVSFLEVNSSDRLAGSFSYTNPPQARRSSQSSSDRYLDLIKYLSSLIHGMTGLRDVSWNYAHHSGHTVPKPLVQALASCPQIRLHTSFAGWVGFNRVPTADNVVYGLEANANLHDLRVCVTFYAAQDCQPMAKFLKNVLLSSRNIRKLSLSITQPSKGCIVYSPPRHYCGFGFVGSDSLPPLEELEITHYPWGVESGGWGSVDGPLIWFRQEGYPGKGSEMDHWADNFDWSQLRRLKTRYAGFALKLMPKLTSLRQVDLEEAASAGETVRFYQECPSTLETIAGASFESISLEGILRHGSALRQLQLHTYESWDGSWSKKAIDVASLRSIRDGCPLIEDLYIDLARDGDWPWDALDTLGTFPRLRNLTICFALGIDTRETPIKPYVTFSAVHKLMGHLQSHFLRQQPPKRLVRLHVQSGAPPPLGHGYPSPEAFWPEYNSTEFVATLSERDDEAALGVYTLICPRLYNQSSDGATSAPQNFRSRFDSATYDVAHNGPTPVSKWQAHF